MARMAKPVRQSQIVVYAAGLHQMRIMFLITT